MADTIPFIYNYCDRWCERCLLKKHCSLNLELENCKEEEMDINHPSFWKKISSSFKKTLTLLKKSAKDEGFDIDEIPEEELVKAEAEMKKKAYVIMDHPLSKRCREYAIKAHDIMKDENYWRRLAESIVKKVVSGSMGEKEGREQAEGIHECHEIIGWYMFQIEVKFARGLSGKMDDEDYMSLQSDANGSAKVALCAVERTIKAFEYLLKITGHKEKYQPVLSLLSQIDKMGREEFPNAPLFIRPGFDEQ
jgi:hypothetical protein